MALDLIQKVLTEYKADTSDHIKELKKLKKEITEQQQAELDAAEKRTATYDKWLENIANVNQAMELGGRALDFAKDAWKSYAEDVRLRAAAGAVSIDKLKEASLGLRTEHELLSFAAKTQNGIIKLNSDQMETAQRAMVALTRAGFDQEEVTNKITNALVKAKAEGLDDFGLAVKQGKTEVETFNNLMSALADKANGVQTGTATAGEGIQKMGVTMSESFEKMKQALGQLVASMAPLLDALARAVGIVADLAKDHRDVQEAGGVTGYVLQNKMGFKKDNRTGIGYATDESRGADAQAEFQGRIDTARGMAGGATAASILNKFAGDFVAYNEKEQAKLLAVAYGVTGGILGALTSGGKATGKGTEKGFGRTVSDSEIKSRALTAARMQAEAILNGATIEAPQATGGVASTSLGAVAGQTFEGFATEDELFKKVLGIDPATLTKSWYDRLNAARDGRESFLESTFGTIEEFSAYRAAFDGVTQALASQYEAIVTGSDLSGKAFKRAVADTLLAIGKQELVLGIKEGAWALGELAYGNLAGAALHGKSSAMHFAAAAAAGVAANSLGTSAQAAASDKAAADKAKADEQAKKDAERKSKSGASGGGSGSDSARPIIVMLGSGFDETSPRQRAARSREAVERALRERDDA